MIYMLKVNMLVATIVFGLAGIFILALFAWTEAKEYVHALRAMQRIIARSFTGLTYGRVVAPLRDVFDNKNGARLPR